MTTLLTVAAAPDAVVACDMTTAADTLGARLAEYRRLFEDALIDRTSTDTSTTFRIAARPEVEEWVLDLVRREARCCSYLSFEVERVGEELVWRTEGVGASDWLVLDEVLVSAEGDSSAALAQELTERTGVPHLT